MSKSKFRYGGKGGPAGQVPQIVNILDEKLVATTATAKSCYWTNYDVLVVEAMFYSNVMASIIVPTDYFSTTHTTLRVIITDPANSRRYEVYQAGENAVYLLGLQSPGANYGVRIYGISFGG